MAAPNWPATLPQSFERSGYNEGMRDGRLRSPMEVGPDKVRNRARGVRPVSGTMLMTAVQHAAFKTFVQDTLGEGVRAFRLPAQGEAGTWLVRLVKPMPTHTFIGVTRRVAIQLEVLPE